MSTRFPPDAIVLAAGLGTRLLPLTIERPKPLVPVAGLPLIERVIAPLVAEGVTNFAINTHYLADQMASAVAALPGRFPGRRFALSSEADGLLDTGGGARRALGLITSDPVLIANSDAFWQSREDAPIERMLARLTENPGAIVLLCAHPARSSGFRRSHDFCLDPLGRITGDSGLPVIFTGLTLLDRDWFEGTPNGPFSMNAIFERALAADRLLGVLLNARWFHIGDPVARDEAESVLRDG
jgi:MurNAc alpha-1-phosphate uridylyltransferase